MIRTDEQYKRLQKGLKTGIAGIVLNGLLALGKITAGCLYGSVAILTDGVNNLTDAGTSAVAVTGFAVSLKEPDETHPAGYSRMEYICGLLVSCILCVSAVSLMKSAVVHCVAGFRSGYAAVVPPQLLAAILASSLVKLFLAGFSSAANAYVQSDLLKGIAADSLIDCGMTAATVIAVFLSPVVMIPLDSLVCIPGAVYIGYTGAKMALENIRKLL
jgi:cation diffusion facilitator family transporter